MKKKLCLAGALSVLMLALCACGSKDDETKSSFRDIDPDEYVTLGDYEDLSVEVTYVTYTEEDVQTCIEQEMEAYIQIYDLYDYETDVSANTVETGSIVNIDYEGKIDGTAFEGGSDQGAHLEIGSGRFIEGFEDGLIGKTVGETVDLNLTFPEDYQNAEYAGKDVVFTVSVNSIDKRMMPEYSDELVSSIYGGAGITTYADYEQYIRDYIADTCDENNQTTLQDAIWGAVYDACEISDPPEELTDRMLQQLEEYFEAYAQYVNMDMETFVTSQMGMDMETFEAQNLESAKEQAKTELVYMALAKAEGIVVDDALMQEVAESEYAQYGYESADQMIENMGEEDFASYVMRKKVLERLEEIVEVKENEPVNFLDASAAE